MDDGIQVTPPLLALRSIASSYRSRSVGSDSSAINRVNIDTGIILVTVKAHLCTSSSGSKVLHLFFAFLNSDGVSNFKGPTVSDVPARI